MGSLDTLDKCQFLHALHWKDQMVYIRICVYRRPKIVEGMEEIKSLL